MEQVSRIGMDTSKHIFQLHGVDAAERPVLRRKLRRRDMIAFFERLPPTRVAIEACGASHHWARLLRGFGHEVQLIAPHLVKPYVKRGKNDAGQRVQVNGPRWRRVSLVLLDVLRRSGPATVVRSCSEMPSFRPGSAPRSAMGSVPTKSVNLNSLP